MNWLAQAVGILAVVSFLLSYQQKKRKNIIIWNATSRVLYIVQYIMLGAFEGAVLDVLGTVSSVAAQNKEKRFIRNHIKTVVVVINLVIIAAGLMLYENVFSLFPIAGVVLHTSAFWISDEKIIRRVSFLGSPFWLVYNIASCAYGSALGDLLTMVSIATAMYRYDCKKKEIKVTFDGVVQNDYKEQ